MRQVIPLILFLFHFLTCHQKIMDNVKVASQKFISAYKKDTPTSLKLIDVYLVYIMLSGILQFVYMMIAGTFPYNAFLAGFISTVGSFVLAGKIYAVQLF